MHSYRTHTCHDLRDSHVGETVRLSGWVHRKRDHGNLLFVDLRDHYGITQVVIETESDHFAAFEALRAESVITVTGKVVARTEETINRNIPTGMIEVDVDDFELQSAQTNCQCRFLETRNIRKKRGCVIDISICAGIAYITTLCCVQKLLAACGSKCALRALWNSKHQF